MMVERHYDDEVLISLLEADRVRSDPHLPSCPSCSGKIDTFRILADAMQDQDVWDTRQLRLDPVPETIASLRAFADRMSAEDSAAVGILAALLAGSRAEWMPRLRAHPEWRTAGVVRGLIGATNHAIDTMPPDAVAMTALATDIADRLDPAAHPSDTVHRLRGAAWRERSYALFYTGEFAAAEKAVDRADREFAQCDVAEYEQARVGIVRALVLRSVEQFPDAIAAAERSATTFLQYDDIQRSAAACLAQAHLQYSRGDFEPALQSLLALEGRLRDTADAETHARVLANIGYAASQLGRIELALRNYQLAAALLDDLKIETEAVRIRWSVASVLAKAGRVDEALSRFEQVQAQFSGLGMFSEAALVSLEIAEILLDRKRFAEVESICRAAMVSFESSGVAHTTRALTALAYMQAAARDRTATPSLVRHVRDYIRHLPQNEHVLFAPPPPDSAAFSARG